MQVALKADIIKRSQTQVETCALRYNKIRFAAKEIGRGRKL